MISIIETMAISIKAVGPNIDLVKGNAVTKKNPPVTMEIIPEDKASSGLSTTLLVSMSAGPKIRKAIANERNAIIKS